MLCGKVAENQLESAMSIVHCAWLYDPESKFLTFLCCLLLSSMEHYSPPVTRQRARVLYIAQSVAAGNAGRRQQPQQHNQSGTAVSRQGEASSQAGGRVRDTRVDRAERAARRGRIIEDVAVANYRPVRFQLFSEDSSFPRMMREMMNRGASSEVDEADAHDYDRRRLVYPRS